MNFEITPDQNFCTFDGQTIFIFVEHDPSFGFNPCKSCVFRATGDVFASHVTCVSVPCRKSERSDKKCGFWAICTSVDYQAFTKMLAAGG